jgi:hypothetical protein
MDWNGSDDVTDTDQAHRTAPPAQGWAAGGHRM